MLNITKEQENGVGKVTLSGRLDTTTAPLLEAELKPFLAEIDELVFDFKDLEYISSAGLRVLLSVHKIMAKKGGMKLLNVRSEVNEIFDVTGFSDILTIE